MNKSISYQVQDNIAILTIDNPPVNALSPGVPEALEQRVVEAADDSNVKAIIVMGAGKTFIAGADISLLQDMAWGKTTSRIHLHRLLLKIEDAPKPVVMAIHGAALGGGLEVAMAGHYRVAVASAQLGQAEVNLGLMPGAEGTQRLPRLVGVEKALEMCVSGKPIGAPEALAAHLLDAIIEGDLLAGALAFAQAATLPTKTRDRNQLLGTREINTPLFASARRLAGKIRPHQQAPLKAIEAIEAATTLPFESGCHRERELFLNVLSSDQAKALIHAFFAERAVAKIPGIEKSTASLPISRIAVIGAGTMGGGIAMSCVNAGFAVSLRESNSQALEAGLARIRSHYETSVQRGRFTSQEVEQRMSLIHPQVNLKGLETADLIIEAVFENMALKKQIFKELDAIAQPACILASNTSSLNIDELASVTARPESVIGMHFFSPANVMRLLEIVRGKATSPVVISTALAFAKRIKKVGVVVGNCSGFVGNRMFFPYMEEAHFLLEEGATPEQVDRALTDFGMAMGIFAVDDLAGIDVAWRVRQELGQYSVLQDQLYALGRYGQKTGKGWYRYGEDRQPVPDPEVLALIEKTWKAPRRISDQEIVEREIYSLVNEGARILEEGFASRSSDIDIIYIYGYGFPNWRGGPLCFADLTGLDKVLATIEKFHHQFGDRWAPAPLLRKLVSEGKTFRDFVPEPIRHERSVRL